MLIVSVRVMLVNVR